MSIVSMVSNRRNINEGKDLTVVVAQLVEQSLPNPEVRGSNPVISRNLFQIFTVNCIEKE